MSDPEWSYTKTPEELRQAFQRQLGHLRRSFLAFDQGHYEEAERIAAVIYTLCHDDSSPKRKNKSRALLTQLQWKRNVRYIETCKEDFTKKLQRYEWRDPAPLATPDEYLGSITYVPAYGRYLNGAINLVNFDDWWNKPIYENGSGKLLTRKRFVFAMRSKDGGSHVDPDTTDVAYHYFSVGKGVQGFKRVPGGLQLAAPLSLGHRASDTLPNDFEKVPNAHWATMRQIGWELEYSLMRAGYADAPPDHVTSSEQHSLSADPSHIRLGTVPRQFLTAPRHPLPRVRQGKLHGLDERASTNPLCLITEVIDIAAEKATMERVRDV